MTSRKRSPSSKSASKNLVEGGADELPSVLLLGGLGMVGINTLKYLVDFKLARYIRVVDKRVPAICSLAPMFLQALEDPCVEFLQADVSLPRHVERAFAAPPTRTPAAGASSSAATGEEATQSSDVFTIIINCAAETEHGFFESVYEQNILEVRRRCAAAAATACVAGPYAGCERYVEVSTAEVYKCHGGGSSHPADEDSSAVEPWTTPAKYHAAAERYLMEECPPELPWVIVRLPVVYGPGDRRGLMPRVACAATYAKTGETMELLWGPDLRVYTVHAQDVASALWHIVCAGPVHDVFNVCDDSSTSQGSLNTLLEKLFGIKTGFYSKIVSHVAKSKLEQLAEEANTGHMELWQELLREAGIPVSAISPYVAPELLSNRSLCVDNNKLKALGFKLSCPRLTLELLEDTVQYWVDLGQFPPIKRIRRKR